ncbi:MAG: efflux RND transporter periplasmic adaptor subunit [Candidatus Cloacimonetes bacterium HGW-Cloacimonetes-1]|jgi:RND family efflux transporter MFP subunit|nr:MAG: efflux RND transporter periplasmic adaptor subunit [Candidatus Cloacimonetes bacterium HGW-Cloacimonetes-1]
MKRVLILMFSLTLLLSACGKKDIENKNLEQIQAEQGIPVRINAIEKNTFVQELIYNAGLSGIQESTTKAMVSDIVVGINAKVGDRVSKGQLIVTFPENTPSAQYDQATTAFNSSKQLFERMQRLFAQGAISQQDMDNVEAGYKVSKANLDASRKMINITAPIDGVITNMKVNVADHVYPGQDLFTVANTSRYRAVLWVPESEISQIKKGTAVTAVWNEAQIKGRVTTIAMALDPDNKAFRVEAELNNTDKSFAPGITADIRLSILSKPNSIVVDRQNIVTENGESYVWIAKDDKAVKTPITVGLDNQLQFEVLSGLSVGDSLITEGINMLSENVKIRIID